MMRLQTNDTRPGGTWQITDRLRVTVSIFGMEIYGDGQLLGVIHLSELGSMLMRVGRRIIRWKSNRF